MAKKAGKTDIIVNGKVLETELTPLGLQRLPDLRPFPVVDLDELWRAVDNYPRNEELDEWMGKLAYFANGYMDWVVRREMEAPHEDG